MQRRMVYFILVFAALLVFVWINGPTVSVDEHLHGGPIGDDVEGFLRHMEGNYEDIVPGTERTIVWANDSTREKTDIALVYLHGYSATRQETAPLTEIVARELNANVYYARLNGHGRTGEALGRARADSWIADTRQAIDIGQRIGRKVVLIGTSTGGTLATWLAAQNDEADVAAYILLSPNFGPRDVKSHMLNWPWSSWWVPLMVPEQRRWEPENELHEQYWTTSYPFKGLFQMMALVKMVYEKDLSQMRKPVLCIFSPDDPVVDAGRIEKAYQRFGSDVKEKLEINDPENGNLHVVAGDILSPKRTKYISEKIVEFISRVVLKGSDE